MSQAGMISEFTITNKLMEYICVRKKQRRNVVHIALFIRENSVGTERML